MKPSKTIAKLSTIKTPLGKMLAIEVEEKLTYLEFDDEKERKIITPQLIKSLNCLDWSEDETPILKHLEKELTRYFDGELSQFSISTAYFGTEFQKKVWQHLLKIPYGNTTSYGNLAYTIGHPKAIRAVANACAANKIALLLPCHRVIGSHGELVGYAGGLWRKQKLLELEKAILL